MALDPAPITGTTSGGAEAYVPVVEPVSPAQLYHAPTPADRSSLTLAGQYMFVAMTTTLPNGAQLAKQLHDNYATTLDVEATEMLIAAMRYIYIYIVGQNHSAVSSVRRSLFDYSDFRPTSTWHSSWERLLVSSPRTVAVAGENGNAGNVFPYT